MARNWPVSYLQHQDVLRNSQAVVECILERVAEDLHFYGSAEFRMPRLSGDILGSVTARLEQELKYQGFRLSRCESQPDRFAITGA